MFITMVFIKFKDFLVSKLQTYTSMASFFSLTEFAYHVFFVAFN